MKGGQHREAAAQGAESIHDASLNEGRDGRERIREGDGLARGADGGSLALESVETKALTVKDSLEPVVEMAQDWRTFSSAMLHGLSRHALDRKTDRRMVTPWLSSTGQSFEANTFQRTRKGQYKDPVTNACMPPDYVPPLNGPLRIVDSQVGPLTKDVNARLGAVVQRVKGLRSLVDGALHTCRTAQAKLEKRRGGGDGEGWSAAAGEEARLQEKLAEARAANHAAQKRLEEAAPKPLDALATAAAESQADLVYSWQQHRAKLPARELEALQTYDRRIGRCLDRRQLLVSRLDTLSRQQGVSEATSRQLEEEVDSLARQARYDLEMVFANSNQRPEPQALAPPPPPLPPPPHSPGSRGVPSSRRFRWGLPTTSMFTRHRR